jgi:excinuclease ABC subunit B
MFADHISEAMDYCIKETARRREIQEKFNKEHNIVPQTIIKALPNKQFLPGEDDGKKKKNKNIDAQNLIETINNLKKEMEACAARMEFEKAAMIRDEIIAIQEENLELGVLEQLGKALKTAKTRGATRSRKKFIPKK